MTFFSFVIFHSLYPHGEFDLMAKDPSFHYNKPIILNFCTG